MRAQVSIETLLLLAVGIVFLSLVFAAGQKVYGMQQRQYDAFAAKGAAVKIANAVDDVCTFGPENVRVVDAGIERFSIEQGERKISVNYNGASAAEEIECDANVEGGAFGNKVLVEYGGEENGEAFAKITDTAG